MPLEPVGCHPDGLPAFANGSDHVWSQKRQLDELLNAAFRDAFDLGDLGEGFPQPDQIEVSVRSRDIA